MNDLDPSGQVPEENEILSKKITSEPPTTTAHDPYLAFRFRDFRLLFIGVFVAAMGEQMLNVAIGWELYERTGSALALGLVGLVQVLPVIFLSLPGGHVADHYNRKYIMVATQSLLAISTLGLTLLSFGRGPLPLIYACLLLTGISDSFGNPAASALISQTIPQEAFENAATWRSSAWQMASVLGPALGGVIIAISRSAAPIYLIDTLAILIVISMFFFIRIQHQAVASRKTTTVNSLLEGVSFLRGAPIILAAITLDLFAVLFGGAVTLLPIFAKDILQVGPVGLGWLRAAPSIGAVSIALLIAHRPPFKKAGQTLLLAVAGFGIATIVFGLSRNFWLSLVMLLTLGGLDNISVVIRGTLLLTRTPDTMRGRVSAVNGLFIAASNQLGGFESGLAASIFGPILATASGGVGTILVVILVALLWPQMRTLTTLTESK